MWKDIGESKELKQTTLEKVANLNQILKWNGDPKEVGWTLNKKENN